MEGKYALKSPTGSKNGKSTDCNIWLANKYRASMLVANKKAPETCFPTLVHFLQTKINMLATHNGQTSAKCLSPL